VATRCSGRSSIDVACCGVALAEASLRRSTAAFECSHGLLNLSRAGIMTTKGGAIHDVGWKDREQNVTRPFSTLIKHLPLFYFGFSILILVFGSGFAVAKLEIFPYSVLAGAWRAALDWRESWRAYLRVRPDQLIEPARFDGDGVTVYVPNKASTGVTLITGFWNGEHGINLVGPDGTHLHEWRVSFNEIWPNASHVDEQPHDWDAYIHGTLLYPNGDLVFNFDYRGLVKIDKCGNVIWQVPEKTHHSIYEDDSGNLWVGMRRRIAEARPDLPLLSVPFQEDFVIKVSPDGQVLREISLLDVIVNSHYESILFGNGRDGVGRWGDSQGVETHMNDIEVLGPAQAPSFPHFEEGDIMVSLRNVNWIAVIDPDTETIKWSQVGPFLRQHDPDFLDNGKISVFDNRTDEAQGAALGGSRILELDPVTHQASTLYESDASNFFYTGALGKQQHLPNGNTLIAEGQAGRAFEVTPEGEVVWSYINRWDDDEVAWIEEATRYPMHYAAFAEEEC
jgi:Arylsulfotransferase (ASST)